jgi:ABC-type antimicrobial peptide transport system permease subunit
MLGIIIGVAAVIVIMSVGAGAQSLILSQIKSLGSNLIGVLPGKSEEKGPPASVYGVVITTLTYDDAMALKKKSNVPNIVDVVAYTKGVGTLSWNNNTYDTNLSGATVGYMAVEGGEVEAGRFFTAEEEKNLSRVAVIGSTVKKELFGEQNPLAQRIKINKEMFEVIGVMKERGTVAFQNYDDQVFIPIMTMQKIVSGVNHLGFLRAKIDQESNIPRAIEDVKATLRERHDITDATGASDDFTVESAAAALDMLKIITDGLKYFLAAVAALSLLVGGIGIMNIMLVSVTERTREIGLRKAVGARSAKIRSQFLLESIFLTGVGGSIGIIFGSLVSYLIAVVAHFLNYTWEFIVPLSSIMLGLSVSILVGLFFGIYPASQAAKLDPIEALRHE